MLSVLLNVLVMAAAIGIAVMYAVQSLGLPMWTSYAILPVLSVACYVGCGVLTGVYIARRAPEFANDEEAWPGVKKWELTAGTGIVPKWVSWVGLASFSCLLAMLVPLVAPLFGEGVP